MAHIYLDNKGRTVFVNKGQEIQDGVFEYQICQKTKNFIMTNS
jgi:hypothetical protein